MNCKEVFNLFEKCGGKLICNYQTKQCVVPGTNLKCVVESKSDKNELEWLIWKNTSATFGIKNDGVKINNNVHRYQQEGDKGIVVNLLAVKN